MGDSARRQRGLRRGDGRRAGNLPKAAGSRSSPRLFGRNFETVGRRDAQADPGQAGTTGPVRLRVRASRRGQHIHDVRPAGGLAQSQGHRPSRRRGLRASAQGTVRRVFSGCQTIVLVQDNLNTHTAASLYAAFPAEEARRLAKRFQWHYTPKHGSWLDMAESELAVLTSQCLDRRIPNKPSLEREVAAWQAHRNKHHAKADWQFTTNDARVKLKRLYPQF